VSLLHQGVLERRRPVNVGGPALPAPHGRQRAVLKPRVQRGEVERVRRAREQSPEPISAISAILNPFPTLPGVNTG